MNAFVRATVANGPIAVLVSATQQTRQARSQLITVVQNSIATEIGQVLGKNNHSNKEKDMMNAKVTFLTLTGLFAMTVGCAFAGNQIIPATGLCDPQIVIQTSSPLRAAETAESNVALATAGAQITADSTGVFGRNDPAYGAADQDITPGRLIDGRWVEKDGGWQEARGNRWISQMDRPHPHWAWISFSGPKRINRVVLRCSSLENYPTDFRGQYSTDGGITVKELFAAKNVKPDTNTLVMEYRFEPVVTGNFRLIIGRSTTPRSPNYTQLSEIEVYGADAAAAPPMRIEAPADKLPARMLKPATDKEVRIEERAGEIEFRTPWQRLVFARNRAQINAVGWDSEGAGRLDINLLEKGEAGGIQPRIEPAYGPVRPLPPCKLRREGNVVRYRPLEAARGVALTWEVKIGAKTVEMAIARVVSRRCGGEALLPDSYHVLNALYHGYYGITFGREGYGLAAWSPLKGQSLKTGLTFMGREANIRPDL